HHAVTADELSEQLVRPPPRERAGQFAIAQFAHVHGKDPFSCIMPSRMATYAAKSNKASQMKERIQKLLANAGVASRRNVEEMILQGRVAVNGKIETTLPILIDPGRDKVAVDGESIKLHGKGSEKRVYLLMNKPRGVYSTNV